LSNGDVSNAEMTSQTITAQGGAGAFPD
jgi:hypothetical protein